jgi:DhnA family fructose-bisphosphate aldolase class Ia
LAAHVVFKWSNQIAAICKATDVVLACHAIGIPVIQYFYIVV